MKLILLSFYKCPTLYYIFLCFTLSVIRCFSPDQTYNESVSTSTENCRTLFQDNPLWKQGDIPLLNRKIFKGMRVTIREHPYIASIRRHIVHYSMATMLTKNLFITVAHPLIDVPLDEIGVVVGENYADRGATLLTVVLVIIHENFDRYTLAADLALLRVYENTPYRCSVKAIQLVHPSKSLAGHRAFVTGWGRCDRTGRELCLPRSSKYTPGEKFDPMLRSVSFVVNIPNLYCERYKRVHKRVCIHTSEGELSYYLPNKAWHIAYITQNGVIMRPGMLCVGRSREEDRVASCLAVPGAPLVVEGHLAALQSWGYSCGYEHDLPLVYTSVQYYQPWLLHNIPLIRRIYKENLKILFEAKRAYILSKWLNITRVVRPEPFILSNRPMETLKLDKELARLRGRILDIRDFLYDGIHHKYKTKLYAKLRHKMFDKNVLQKTQLLHISLAAPKPFLNPNETEVDEAVVEEESMFKDKSDIPENESDKSYEEYV